MLNIDSTEKHNIAMPRFVIWLLSKLVNPAYRDELIGDMEEEYKERQETNQGAGKWLFRQVVSAVWDGQKAMVKSTNFLKVLSVVLCLLVLPVIALFVGWLSNMGAPSEQLWQLLLAGEIHSILLNGNYWKEAWSESGILLLEPAMFVNIPSIIWAMVFAGSAYVYLRRFTPSVWIFSAIALTYTLLPYLFGYLLIGLIEPAPQKVGPILAFMILAPFFTIPVYVYFLLKRFPTHSRKYS